MAGSADVAKGMKGIGSDDVMNIFDKVLEILGEDGERVIIRGFGTFTRKVRAGGERRNPATGDSVTVPPKSVLHFKAAKETVIVLEAPKKKAKAKK